MTVTVEELYRQAQQLPPEERRRLATLLAEPPAPTGLLAERLRAARLRILASGAPLLDWPELEAELASRRGER